MLFCVVPAPNEPMITSGSKRKDSDGPRFRIVTGHGWVVNPFKQIARKLSLDLGEAQITEPCVTKQGIQLSDQGVAVFKVGDDDRSLANAARSFLDQQDYGRTHEPSPVERTPPIRRLSRASIRDPANQAMTGPCRPQDGPQPSINQRRPLIGEEA